MLPCGQAWSKMVHRYGGIIQRVWDNLTSMSLYLVAPSQKICANRWDNHLQVCFKMSRSSWNHNQLSNQFSGQINNGANDHGHRAAAAAAHLIRGKLQLQPSRLFEQLPVPRSQLERVGFDGFLCRLLMVSKIIDYW